MSNTLPCTGDAINTERFQRAFDGLALRIGMPFFSVTVTRAFISDVTCLLPFPLAGEGGQCRCGGEDRLRSDTQRRTGTLTRLAALATLSRKGEGKIQLFTGTGPVPAGRSFSMRMPRRLATSVYASHRDRGGSGP